MFGGSYTKPGAQPGMPNDPILAQLAAMMAMRQTQVVPVDPTHRIDMISLIENSAGEPRIHAVCDREKGSP